MFSTRLRPMTPKPTMPISNCCCDCLLVMVLSPEQVAYRFQSALLLRGVTCGLSMRRFALSFDRSLPFDFILDAARLPPTLFLGLFDSAPPATVAVPPSAEPRRKRASEHRQSIFSRERPRPRVD